MSRGCENLGDGDCAVPDEFIPAQPVKTSAPDAIKIEKSICVFINGLFFHVVNQNPE
jgi:hypothetical protein